MREPGHLLGVAGKVYTTVAAVVTVVVVAAVAILSFTDDVTLEGRILAFDLSLL